MSDVMHDQSRTFYSISRHLLFDRFLFHPYTVNITDALLLPEPQKLELSLDRLNFWCSEDVAPLVRSCIINPWDTEIRAQAMLWTTLGSPSLPSTVGKASTLSDEEVSRTLESGLHPLRSASLA
ncbi:hypothetical protein C8R43DRAFT_958694 [Mycena crocata]|nr:hypothetical protein C8R43DRAFT_958694 [Mycena crocata]